MIRIARLLVIIASITLIAPLAGSAEVIALWNFNDGNITVDQGTGTMSFVGGTGYGMEADPGKVDPNDPGYYSIEVTNWPVQTATNKIAGMQYAVPTTGKSNIKVKFDIRHNIKNGESCPNTVLFQYSTNGTTWVDGPTWQDSGDQWYLNREVDLSNTPNVANNPNFKFRIMAAWQAGAGQYMPCTGSNYGTARKWRLDLITVHNNTQATTDKTIALWDFNDQRDLIADYGNGVSQAKIIGGITLDGDGYSDDFLHNEEPWDFSSSSDPALKGKGFDTNNYPAQGQGNLSAGIECRVSTADCAGIKIKFDIKHKMQSAKHIRALYTTNINANPVVWTPAEPLFTHEITDTITQTWWFNNNVVDLTSVPEVNNNPNFAFKIVSAFDPFGSGYAASKVGETYNADVYYNKHRWDMIRVTAQTAPTGGYADLSIVDAKKSREWDKVAITEGVVTAMHPDYFWIQPEHGLAGIKVYAPQHNISDGWKVNVTGITRKSRDTEKYIYSDSVVQRSLDTVFLKPVFMPHRSVGGSDWFYNADNNSGQCAVPDGIGLSNVGTLVKVFGKVTAVMHEDDDYINLDFIYIDDGSHLVDGTLINPDMTIFERGDDPAQATPVTGLRVVLTKNFSQDLVSVGDYVLVEGASSIDRISNYNDACCRAIRRPTVTVTR